MSYSARRGFSNGSMRPTGAQRQQEMQQKLQEMQEAMNRAQEDVEAKEFTATVGGGARRVGAPLRNESAGQGGAGATNCRKPRAAAHDRSANRRGEGRPVA